jgi:hypothetical protein
MPSTPPTHNPPATSAKTGVPANVIKTREELESLRDDALRLQRDAGGIHPELPWLPPNSEDEGLRGILNSVRWLLGEIDTFPITDELHVRPVAGLLPSCSPGPDGLPTVRQIGREKQGAEDAILRNGHFRLIPEWYAAGTLRTLEWATLNPDPPA